VYARQCANLGVARDWRRSAEFELLFVGDDAMSVVMGNTMSTAKKGSSRLGEVVIDRVWRSDSHLGNRQLVFRLGATTLRASIHCDFSYPFQGRSKIEKWDGAWIEVHSIPGVALRTRRPSGELQPGHFDADVDELLLVARFVLGAELQAPAEPKSARSA
jgi:hypothetical protein